MKCLNKGKICHGDVIVKTSQFFTGIADVPPAIPVVSIEELGDQRLLGNSDQKVF
jgi:hypothetical protein